MPSANTKLAKGEATDLPPADLKRVRQLMTRDRLSWSEFLRRAVQAYDLMYTRTE